MEKREPSKKLKDAYATPRLTWEEPFIPPALKLRKTKTRGRLKMGRYREEEEPRKSFLARKGKTAAQPARTE